MTSLPSFELFSETGGYETSILSNFSCVLWKPTPFGEMQTAFVVSHSIAADSLPSKHCFLCVQLEIINIRTPQMASGDGNLRTGLCWGCRKDSELKNAVISSKHPHF